MEVLEAHQDRIARLRETLERLIGLHRRLYELRSESWREQVEGDPDRADQLHTLHAQIDEVEADAEMLRELFREGLAESAPELQSTSEAEAAPRR